MFDWNSLFVTKPDTSEAMPIEYEAMSSMQIVITASTPCVEVKSIVDDEEPEIDQVAEEAAAAEPTVEAESEMNQAAASTTETEDTEEPVKKLEEELVQLEKIQESYAWSPSLAPFPFHCSSGNNFSSFHTRRSLYFFKRNPKASRVYS